MKITQRFVDSLKSTGKDTFYRDAFLKGFAVKLGKGGTISYVVETKINGRSKRIKVGNHPASTVADARVEATIKLQLMHKGIDPVLKQKKEYEADQRQVEQEKSLSVSFGAVFESYMSSRTLKPITIKDYYNTVKVVFGDWVDLPIRSINRRMVEDIFTKTRDNRGKSQAVKSMRILSAIMNFAMADEIAGERLISDNPCDVLKQKRYNRTIAKRETYLDENMIGQLFHYFYSIYDHPQTPKSGVTRQGINYVMLLLLSGLRKSEALGVAWSDVDWSKKIFVVRDTKNKTDHWIPISGAIGWILENQREVSKDSEWVFPARSSTGHMTEPKSQLKKIIEASGVSFNFHDCRRTFATHARVNGAEQDVIRRALNHKSGGSITDTYIIGRVDLIRPVFEAVAKQYDFYYLAQGNGKALEDDEGNLITSPLDIYDEADYADDISNPF